MPRRKIDPPQVNTPRELPPIQVQMSARQQREVARYGENFGLEPIAVVRQIQARVGPAVDAEIVALTRSSDSYEKARVDQERALRARFLSSTAERHPQDGVQRSSSPIALAEPSHDVPPESSSYIRTGT